jgi:hypothetical protein
MSRIIAVLLFAFALPCHSQSETVWLTNKRMLSCSPSRLHGAGVLTLNLGPRHGRELGVRRHSDDTWYFLVVGYPPEKSKTLMAPEIFETKRKIEIPASSITTDWVTGEDAPIFSSSGKYSFYVSDNLESETGGYMCTVEYRRHRP